MRRIVLATGVSLGPHSRTCLGCTLFARLCHQHALVRWIRRRKRHVFASGPAIQIGDQTAFAFYLDHGDGERGVGFGTTAGTQVAFFDQSNSGPYPVSTFPPGSCPYVTATSTVAAGPEPATWAMTLVDRAFEGGVARYRRRCRLHPTGLSGFRSRRRICRRHFRSRANHYQTFTLQAPGTHAYRAPAR